MQDQPCAGAIVFDDARRLLLIRRGRPPALGMWSVPGGRCLPGEDPATACVREALEETGLAVQVLRLAGRVTRPAPDGGRYVIDDFVCRIVGGTVRAGDDAIEARWATREELGTLPLAPLLAETLEQWTLLPD